MRVLKTNIQIILEASLLIMLILLVGIIEAYSGMMIQNIIGAFLIIAIIGIAKVLQKYGR